MIAGSFVAKRLIFAPPFFNYSIKRLPPDGPLLAVLLVLAFKADRFAF
jgi:hypothetical protein